ncbi:TetR/AcrR family transcriptional regulator [Marinoscillum sp. MHG1-6]|uniref:TetR/AcrR family transcriptional regulator n=1 Tax=Marinoscillum sp. MHG1-6 TaxID=2959627 RepID=UPI002156FDD3|nr:TetR/AcrR family transcriptional regulator [Marinoscillum sp. MHG1-6]
MNEHSFNFVVHKPKYIHTVRLRDEQKQATIQQKAIEIIVADGFDGLSMHKLAKAAQVSPATIYIYYKDRDDLIIQLSIDAERKMFEATMEGFDPHMSFAEGLRHQWKSRASYFLKHPVQMHFLEQVRYSKYHEEVFHEAKADYIARLTSFVQNAIDNKELTPLPLEVYWSLAFAPLYQLVKFHINQKGMHGKPYILEEKTIELAASLVLKGLKP